MSESCKYGYDDCLNDRSKCLFCSNGMSYKEPKKRTPIRKPTQKADKRMGSGFEKANHDRNVEILSSRMTINSGATTKEKGDENVVIGAYRLMEELKTQEPERARGCKSFSIKREWLNKLHTEALKKNQDFWHLKFAFNEDEAATITRAERFSEGNPAGNVFVILEQDTVMAWVQVLAQDEIKVAEIDDRMRFLNKKNQALEAENVALKAKVDELEAKFKLAEPSVRIRMLNEVLEKLAG